MNKDNHPISIAPMLAYTDRHFRYLLRLISKHTLLYTEMVVAQSLIHTGPERFLKYNEIEHPIAVQFGGNDPKDLACCTKIANNCNFDEINLNVGCPSERVQAGEFGLALLKKPNLVVDCVKAMLDVSEKPVTIKTRLGVDDIQDYEYLTDFIGKLAETGCEKFILHARFGFLNLKPKQNRTKPTIDYQKVYRLKKDFSDLTIIVNGHISDISQIKQHLLHTDGVMIGRPAYGNPYFLAEADKEFYGDNHIIPTREEIAEKIFQYIEAEKDIPPHRIKKHMMGLYHGQKNSKKWKQMLAG